MICELKKNVYFKFKKKFGCFVIVILCNIFWFFLKILEFNFIEV